MTTREIRFAADRSLGFVHVREGDYPFSFHGRYTKKGDGPADLDGNEDWTLVGEAQGVVVVPADRSVMLEVLAESARDLSSLSTLAPDSINAIWLGNTWVDDEQLVHLSRLTGLQWLDIQNNGQITDNGIAQLRPLRSLRSLGLHWTRITDKSIDVFRNLPLIKYLDIWGCDVSSDAIAEFRKAATKCEIRTE